MALVATLLAMVLLSALGAAVVLGSSAETLIAANHQGGREGFYAASSALEKAIADLASETDWNRVLDGSVRSAFVDGPPTGTRPLADGTMLSFSDLVNRANCNRVTTCTAAQMNALTAARPWGVNNPRWRLYAYGRLRDLLPPEVIDSLYYVTVLVADDQSETDGQPARDGDGVGNPGAGILMVRAEAFGPRAAHGLAEATVARAVPALRMLSWRLP